eukprot:UN26826
MSGTDRLSTSTVENNSIRRYNTSIERLPYVSESEESGFLNCLSETSEEFVIANNKGRLRTENYFGPLKDVALNDEREGESERISTFRKMLNKKKSLKGKSFKRGDSLACVALGIEFIWRNCPKGGSFTASSCPYHNCSPWKTEPMNISDVEDHIQATMKYLANECDCNASTVFSLTKLLPVVKNIQVRLHDTWFRLTTDVLYEIFQDVCMIQREMLPFIDKNQFLS